MSKIYFAKYLPVEGEIKDGFFFENGGLVQLCSFSDYPKSPSAIYKAAKLFLCSRDIQVGDEMFSGRTSRSLGEVDTKPDVETCIKNNWFKVIGEISPDATWVKEGDEFDEDEVEHWFRYTDDGHRIPVEKDDIQEYINNPEEWYDHIIKIKGPCGHFH